MKAKGIDEVLVYCVNDMAVMQAWFDDMMIKPSSIVTPCVEINQCVDNMTRPCRLRRAARNRHPHAIEQAPRRWRGGRRND